MGNKEIIAPCGINCTQCEIRKAATDPEYANKLAAIWQKHGHHDASPEWFRCLGCNCDDSTAWCSDCKIRVCCLRTRKLENCSYCDDFPCRDILDFENDPYSHHTIAVASLREMRHRRSQCKKSCDPK